jgi:acetate kinase
MNVLVINCGSSSLKFRLFAMPAERLLAQGLVERIGDHEGWATLTCRGRVLSQPLRTDDHAAALDWLLGALSGEEIGAIGHRVVHGGQRFTRPERVDAAVLDGIRAVIPLAPLHNPANLAGIEGCAVVYPDVPQVAVFDTMFHQTLPEVAYRYAVPEAWYVEHGVRRFGFQGISHGQVAARAAALLGKPLAETNLITLHLGNGASATAIRGGCSVDTSMGMTPLEGLVMGTRSGDLDPAIPAYLRQAASLTADEVDDHLLHRSGLQGLCGEHDMREILKRCEQSDARAGLALELYVYRIRKYIGAYLAVLGRVDALVFTAGVGEHSPEVRARVCSGLDGLGIRLDAAANQAARGVEAAVHGKDASIGVYVIPVDEEIEIARQTMACLARQDNRDGKGGNGD